MRKIDGAELAKIQLEILDVVSQFCEKHKINYWLDCGTLLGAIRHKGFIPWDDDIDIGMLRPEYDRFMKLFNIENERYKFYCIENNENFLYPHGKVLDTSTILYEPNKKGNKLSINIDIFVYDNAPDDDKILKKMYKKRDMYYSLRDLQFAYTPTSKSIIKRTSVSIINFMLRVLPKNFFVKKILHNSKHFSDITTKRVGNFTSCVKIACNKTIFNEFVDVEFEGKLYKAPAEYDIWLKAFYNDYMQLPPVEDRVSHHVFEAYTT